MNFLLGLMSGSLFVLATSLSSSASAQSENAGFDPAHPFANIKTAEEWVNKFKTGKPNITPDDPFGNYGADELTVYLHNGANFDHPGLKMSAMKGKGGHGGILRSPYPYRTAEEHYDAWLKAAHGGTKMTRDKLPDWSGDWENDEMSNDTKLSEDLAAVSDKYKPRFVQSLRADWLQHRWDPKESCLPVGFGNFWNGEEATWHFMSDQKMVEIGRDRFNEETRWIYTDGRGFLPKDIQFPQWYGASIGFWDGDELVVITNQIKPWRVGQLEYSAKLETVERIKRIKDEIIVDETLYDPDAFAYPHHIVATFKFKKNWAQSPVTYQDCVSTNNVHMTADGEYDEYGPGDLNYRDLADDRPWASAYKRWDHAHPNVPQWSVPKNLQK